MDRYSRLSAIFILCLTFSSVSEANTWLFVEGDPGISTWKVEAIRQTVLSSLSDLSKITIQEPPSSDSECDHSDIDCLMKQARSHDIDIVLRATVGETEFRLESFDSRAHAFSGAFEMPFGEMASLKEFRHRVYRLLRPFIQSDYTSETNDRKLPAPVLFFLAGLFWAFALDRTGRALFPSLGAGEDLSASSLKPAINAWTFEFLKRLAIFILISGPLFFVTSRLSTFISPDSFVSLAFLFPISLILANSLYAKTFSHFPFLGRLEPHGKLKRYFSVTAIIAISILGILGAEMAQSARYHPVYTKRMNDLKIKKEQHQRRQQERTHGTR